MSLYPEIALKSVNDVIKNPDLSPREAWNNNAIFFYPDKVSSQQKGCPKSTFLGLCEEGLVKGIKSGSYTKSKLNKRYGIEAVGYLRSQPNLSESELWLLISHKSHNEQMNVVKVLFNNGYIQL